jgi:hypothetical protein
MNALRSVDDADQAGEVEALHLVIGDAPRSEVEREIGCRRECPAVAGHRMHPPRRAGQERQRAHQVGTAAVEDRRRDPEHQAHIVVKRQPGDQLGARG